MEALFRRHLENAQRQGKSGKPLARQSVGKLEGLFYLDLGPVEYFFKLGGPLIEITSSRLGPLWSLPDVPERHVPPYAARAEPPAPAPPVGGGDSSCYGLVALWVMRNH